MAPQPQDLVDALEERKHARAILDEFGSNSYTYTDWHNEISEVYDVYANIWPVTWPDFRQTRDAPKVANLVQLAADDRARAVAAVKPSLICRPDKLGDKAKAASEKRERILGGYHYMNRMPNKVWRWAYDAMAGGLTAVRVLPDFEETRRTLRFPKYQRLDPAMCFPDPLFSEGPFIDSMIYSYEERLRTVVKRYQRPDLAAWSKDPNVMADAVNVIEFADDEWYMVILTQVLRPHATGTAGYEVVIREQHKMGKCPVVIGTRATMDGVYRGEFMGGLGVLNFANQLMTLVMDDAINKVYPAKKVYNIANSNEWGPDAELVMETPDAVFEFIQPPNQPFTNMQLIAQVLQQARSAAMLPVSRSGDPNETIISAAGVNITQNQFNEDVANIERLIIAPMLEAANELAFKADEEWADVEKEIFAYGPGGDAIKETYRPSVDIT